MEDYIQAQQNFAKAFQAQQKQSQLFGQGIQTGTTTTTSIHNSGGLSGAQYFTYPTPQITITPVAVKVEHYDTTKAVQVLYRFGKGLVQGCVIKGTNNIKTATDVFLGQFTTDEPEIVAVVEIALAA